MQDTTALALTAGPRLTEIHRTLQGIGREALGLAVEAGDGEYNRMLFTSDREWREFRHQQLTGGR